MSSAVILVLAAGLVFSSGVAKAQKAARLNLGIIPITEMMTLYIATEKGYFVQEGLEVERTPMAGGAVILPALVGGSVDIGYSNIVSIILARAEGLPVKIIMHNKSEETIKAPDIPKGYKGGSAIMVRANSDIRTAKEMEGKKFAVNTLNNINWLFAQEWMRIGGAEPAKAIWVEVPFPNMIAMLDTGQVDAITAADPTLTILKSTGKGRVLDYYFSTVKPNVMVASWVATEKGIKERPEVLKKFVAAMSRAIDYVNAHRQEWPAILARNMRIDPAVIGKLEEGHRFDPKVDMDHLRWYTELMTRRGLLRRSVDPGTLISPVGS